MEMSVRATDQELKLLPCLASRPPSPTEKERLYHGCEQSKCQVKGEKLGSEYLCMYRRGNLVQFSYGISLLCSSDEF